MVAAESRFEDMSADTLAHQGFTAGRLVVRLWPYVVSFSQTYYGTLELTLGLTLRLAEGPALSLSTWYSQTHIPFN